MVPPILEHSESKNITGRAIRALSVIKETGKWNYDHLEEQGAVRTERRAVEKATEIIDNIFNLVGQKLPRVSSHDKKQLIEKTLNEMGSIMTDSGQEGKIALVISSLQSKKDEAYKTNKIEEWSKKFPNSFIPIEAVLAFVTSPQVNIEQKEAIINDAFNRLDSKIIEDEKHDGYIHPSGAYHYDKLGILRSAAEAGIKISDFNEKINKLVTDVKRGTKPTFESTIGRFRNEILSDIEIGVERIRSLYGEKRNDLGTGLQIEEAQYGHGARLYLNGEFITATENSPQFSKQSFNKEVATWVERELIGHDCIVKGYQWRDNVYVWKSGWDLPKIIFEDHAYEYERHFRVHPPIVTPGGKIEIVIEAEGEEKKKTISL